MKIAHMDRQWAGEKQPTEQDHSMLPHFGSET